MPDSKMEVCQLRMMGQLLRQGEWALHPLLCSVMGGMCSGKEICLWGRLLLRLLAIFQGILNSELSVSDYLEPWSGLCSTVPTACVNGMGAHCWLIHSVQGITSSYSHYSKRHDVAPALRGDRFRLAEDCIASPKLRMFFLEAVF